MQVFVLLCFLFAFNSAEKCSQECEREFVDSCMPYWCERGGSTEAAYDQCSTELEKHEGPLANVCEEGCEATKEMQGATCGDDPSDKPTEPTVCDSGNKGRCDCSSDEGFTTYTFWQGELQRCFTVYTPKATLPAPVLLSMQCYAKDKLSGQQMYPGSELIMAADRYGFNAVALSTPNGYWTWGNDNVVNDTNPKPCRDEDSIDIAYTSKIFNFLSADAKTFDYDAIYTTGFSQNSVYSGFIGICFGKEIAGISQGGSGLILHGQQPYTPGLEAQCRQSDYLEIGSACLTERPCNECQYCPAYPVANDGDYIHCIFDYLQDSNFYFTMANMYDAMEKNGYDTRSFLFDEASGGHHWMENWADWLVGCWGMTDVCSAKCESSFKDCVNFGHTFSECNEERDYLDGCTSSCAATYDMMILSENPTEYHLSKGVFGRNDKSKETIIL